MKNIFLSFVVQFIFRLPIAIAQGEEDTGKNIFQIDGKVVVPFTNDQDWMQSTRILVDGGEYLGFLK